MIYRPGMWVVDNEGRLGILVRIASEDKWQIHFVNDKGETIGVKVTDLRGLAQAKLSDIPKPRRPEKKMAEALGYA